tara:strand:+ start:4609 stop:4836 length:228 start_codon:yes stop_codon:yes gene_type:complete
VYLPPSGLTLKNAPGVFVVILNKRGATKSGAFSASTRRAGAIFPPYGVENDLCRTTTSHHFRLVGQKNSRQQWWL